MQRIKQIKQELETQDNRSTSFPIFIVVEDKKIYGIDSGCADGKERKEDCDIEFLCESCGELHINEEELSDDCDDCDSECFYYYRIERNVPNLYAGFFFTAKACNEHLEANRHHYNSTAHSYAISATHNSELQTIIAFIKGEINVVPEEDVKE